MNVNEQENTGRKKMQLREAVLEVVEELEARLGRLIAAVAKDSFHVWESGHVAFAEWPVLQYIVPGHISALVAVAQISDSPLSRARIHKLIALLHTMIQFYEKKYFMWLNG
jgi:hypothetical protein